jgi:hypothetical protein
MPPSTAAPAASQGALDLRGTIASSLVRRYNDFAAETATGQVRRSRLDAFMNDNLNATGQLILDLERAGALIYSFSQVAVDRSGAKRRSFNLKLVTEQIISSLRSGLPKSRLSLTIQIPDSIIMDIPVGMDRRSRSL